MSRITKTITFSLPSEMAKRVDEVEREWRELFRYGEERARENGIGPENVARLVEEHRAEVGPSHT